MSGKVVAVTGAASGIGREIARAFAQAGAAVAALDINEAALEKVAADNGGRAYRCDVTDTVSVASAFETLAKDMGGLDILVSNAGSACQGAIGDLPMEDLRRSFELNFFGHQNACQAAVRIFRRQGRGGSILFNISNQSVNPGKDFGPYGIPKAAAMALMKQYALDHGHEGIRANGINAGRIRSGLMTDQMIVERARARGLTPHEYMSGNLLGVEVTASDIADAFLHLAQMDKVNAAVLTVDGGVVATSLR
jgi:NAD(P)-dependent dehydrogenase (short-subunit alcohol dehydrogenase family)